MRRDLGPQTWLFPMPVLIVGTYDENRVPNVMTAAWGGIHDTKQIAVCIDPGHKTADNLRRTGCFTVGAGTAETVAACDYVGLVSGRDVPDKLARVGWHAHPGTHVDAPVVEELPFVLECRLVSFDPQTGCTAGDIVNVTADERILDAEGKIDAEKLDPIVFDPVRHVYRKLGRIAGTAFADGKKFK